MPVYEFVCSTCGAHFEKWISFRQNGDEVTCPNGHKQVARVYSAPAVVFKGSGWYSTDHRPKTEEAK
jgi:putative FmdB family regulatory protein